MLNITNHEGNANQTCNELSPYTCWNGYYEKDKKEQVLMRIVEKRDPLYTVGENIDWWATMENML